MWQGSNSKLILRIMQIVKSNHITPRNEFRGQIPGSGCEAIKNLKIYRPSQPLVFDVKFLNNPSLIF